jgi:hypothetical protein
MLQHIVDLMEKLSLNKNEESTLNNVLENIMKT